MTRTLDVDYLVIGAGAMGMGFTDALIDHSDARVAVVDRRHAAGGHWLEDYPFVRLHQSSTFYGVASTVLAGGRVQEQGPEAGLHARASQPEIVDYYARQVERMRQTGRVEVLTGADHLGDGTVVSRISGQRWEAPASCRVVNAHHLAPSIPAESSAPFAVADDARVVTVNDVVRLEEAPSQYVVVGSGKTATDACVWLLDQGVDPGAICWVRPREPWMLDRALIQPDPEVFLGVPAAMFEAAVASSSLDELFLRLEEAGVMMRIDRSLTPTMAKAPTLGLWELELLRSIEDVVRHGHLRSVSRGWLEFSDGSTLRVAEDAVVVHCAADGLKNTPLSALPLRQLARAVGRDERARHPRRPDLRRRARHRGLGQRRRPQPLPHPGRPPRLARARRRPRAADGRRLMSYGRGTRLHRPYDVTCTRRSPRGTSAAWASSRSRGA